MKQWWLNWKMIWKEPVLGEPNLELRQWLETLPDKTIHYIYSQSIKSMQELERNRLLWLKQSSLLLTGLFLVSTFLASTLLLEQELSLFGVVFSAFTLLGYFGTALLLVYRVLSPKKGYLTHDRPENFYYSVGENTPSDPHRHLIIERCLVNQETGLYNWERNESMIATFHLCLRLAFFVPAISVVLAFAWSYFARI